MRTDLSYDQLEDEFSKQKRGYVKYVYARRALVDCKPGDKDYVSHVEEVERWEGRFRWREVWGWYSPQNGLSLCAPGHVPSRRMLSTEGLEGGKAVPPSFVAFSATPLTFSGQPKSMAKASAPVALQQKKSEDEKKD